MAAKKQQSDDWRQKLRTTKTEKTTSAVSAAAKEIASIPAHLNSTWTACTTARQYELLTKVAKIRGVSKQQILREALDAYLSKQSERRA